MCIRNAIGAKKYVGANNLEFGAGVVIILNMFQKEAFFGELFLVHLGLEGKLFMLQVVTEKSEQKTISGLSAITRCSMLFHENIMKQP